MFKISRPTAQAVAIAFISRHVCEADVFLSELGSKVQEALAVESVVQLEQLVKLEQEVPFADGARREFLEEHGLDLYRETAKAVKIWLESALADDTRPAVVVELGLKPANQTLHISLSVVYG